MKCSNCGSKLNAWSWRRDFREGSICPKCGQRNPSRRRIGAGVILMLSVLIVFLFDIYARERRDIGTFLVLVLLLAFLAFLVLEYKWRLEEEKPSKR
jgi:hypothetical protein